jgi:tetratricopeptide (TPR) repeat protein
MQLIPDVSRTGIKHEQARDYQRTRRLGVAVLAELGTGDSIEAAAYRATTCQAYQASGYDDNADVATLLGYASRKLSRYDDAKMWYERALAADPNHAVTWSYYGMWQAEQGNVLKAKDDLEKVRLICGTDCKAFQMLKDAIDGTVTY